APSMPRWRRAATRCTPRTRSRRCSNISGGSAMSTRSVPLSSRAIPIVAAGAVTVVVGFVSQVVEVKVLAAAVVGAIAIVLIRIYPMITLAGLSLTRAALEGMQTHHVVHAIGVNLSPPDLIEIAF